jgi:DNA mismatch repair protein MutL
VAETRSAADASDDWHAIGKAAPADGQDHSTAPPLPAAGPQPSTAQDASARPATDGQFPSGTASGFSDMRLIGQLANTYIVCEGPEGLLLIDQHAAHERILFEQLSRRDSAAGVKSQKLLVPETVELDFSGAAALKPMLPRLDELGLQVEPFGGNTFVVRALPAPLAGRDPAGLVKELAEQALQMGIAAHLATFLDACRMVVACHDALRAHQRLDDSHMKALLRQLDGCENPSHCPHGRPTWVKWDLAELEKMFKRKI